MTETNPDTTRTLSFTLEIDFSGPVPLAHSTVVADLILDALTEWVETGPGFYYPRDDANMDNEENMDPNDEDGAITASLTIATTTPGTPALNKIYRFL